MQPGSRSVRRWDWAAVGLLAALSVGFFWQGLIQPAEMIHEDAAYYYQPWYTYAAAEVQAGRLPLWNPYSLLGIPYHAGLQASLFYPLRWPLFWIDFVHGYPLLLCIHYFLTGAAAFLLMRAALRIRPPAALAGAISITFGGFAMGHLSHLTYVMAYPWFLFCTLCVWLAVERRRWIWAVLAGVNIGLLCLIGAVHLLLLLGILLGSFLVWHTAVALLARIRACGTWGDVMRPAGVVVLAGAVGTLCGAVQLLPAYALHATSLRQTITWSSINSACAHPLRNSLQLAVPFYFGNLRLGYWGEYNYQDMAHYTGILVLIAACVGLLHLGRNRYLWFLPVLATVGLLISAGEYLPVYETLYDNLPGFDQFRNPSRIFWCTHIALACLAAIGLDRMLGAPPSLRARLVGTVASVAILLVMLLAMRQLVSYAEHPKQLEVEVRANPKVFQNAWKPLHLQAARDVPRMIVRAFDRPAWAQIVAGATTAVLLSVLLWRRRIGRVGGATLLLLLIAELLASSFGTMQYDRSPHEHRAIVGTPPLAQWLQQNLGQARYLMAKTRPLPSPDDEITENRGMQFGLRHIGGVGGGILDSSQRLEFCAAAAQSLNVFTAAGGKYLISDSEVRKTDLPEVWRHEGFHVYENRRHLPLVRCVQRLTQAAGWKAALQTLSRQEFEPAAEAVVEETPPELSARHAEVLRARGTPGKWEVETDCDGPAQLVISEGYAPGWRCTINAAPAHVYRTNAETMSVTVPGGRSVVMLEYAPREFRQGAWLSCIGVMMTCGLAAWSLRPGRKPAPA